MTEKEKSWWIDYFSSLYRKLYKGPLRNELETEAEIELLGRIFRSARAPVVDLGCAYGRHLTPLLERGLPVVGVDYSRHLFEGIPKKLAGRLLLADMRRLPFQNASTGGVYMMFNTFGYFGDRENGQTLREIARVLKPGAPLVFDIPANAGMTQLVSETPTAFFSVEGAQIHEKWKIDQERSRLLCTGRWELGEERQSWELSLRLYSPGEIEALCREAGFSGTIRILPLDRIDELGNDEPPEKVFDMEWEQATNMIILAYRS